MAPAFIMVWSLKANKYMYESTGCVNVSLSVCAHYTEGSYYFKYSKIVATKPFPPLEQCAGIFNLVAIPFHLHSNFAADV